MSEQTIERIPSKKVSRKVYFPQEISELIAISKNDVYKFLEIMLNKNMFPVIKVGTRYRVPIKQFDDWIETVGSLELVKDESRKVIEVVIHERARKKT